MHWNQFKCEILVIFKMLENGFWESGHFTTGLVHKVQGLDNNWLDILNDSQTNCPFQERNKSQLLS